ncbi:MAG: bacterioferritin-associated ferredoxin [Flavobacteriaceae bacterium]
MLICQCNVITEREIVSVLEEMLSEDPWQLIVPAQVYHAMGKRGRCCGCFPNLVGLIVGTVEAHHRAIETPEPEIVSLVDRLRCQYDAMETRRREMRVRHRAA